MCIRDRLYLFDNQKNIAPTTDCVAPNCAQLYLSAAPNTPAGARTVTFKHPDGRSLTTTFDVTESATRCEKGGGGPKK